MRRRAADPDARGTASRAIRSSIGAGFDGWGYTHLYDNDGDDLEAVDHFAIEEATDERYALGFGDLTVHEFATDPTENLAYSSYYAGGLRVLSFGDDGLEQVGKFIDKGGNNFWGVEHSTARRAAPDRRRRTATSACTCSGTRGRARRARPECSTRAPATGRGRGRRSRSTLHRRERQPAHARGRRPAGPRHGRA